MRANPTDTMETPQRVRVLGAGGMGCTIARTAEQVVHDALRALDQALLAAALHVTGVRLVELADIAGLVTARAVGTLVDKAAVLARQPGTAYPRGPLAWRQSRSAPRLPALLRHLFDYDGEARYRIALRLSETCRNGVALDA